MGLHFGPRKIVGLVLLGIAVVLFARHHTYISGAMGWTSGAIMSAFPIWLAIFLTAVFGFMIYVTCGHWLVNFVLAIFIAAYMPVLPLAHVDWFEQQVWNFVVLYNGSSGYAAKKALVDVMWWMSLIVYSIGALVIVLLINKIFPRRWKSA